MTTAWERDLGERRTKLTASLAPTGVTGPDDEPTPQSFAEDRDSLARRVDVLTTRVALLVERERRAGSRLVEAELRAARAAEGPAPNVEVELGAAQAEELAAERLAHIEAIHRTLSWRITAPLRWLSTRLRG